MASTTKTGMIATVLAMATLAALGFYVLEKTSDQANLVLDVSFQPTPRKYPVKISVQLGSAVARTYPEVLQSPWSDRIVVRQGALVTLVATQTSGGKLKCRIINDGNVVKGESHEALVGCIVVTRA